MIQTVIFVALCFGQDDGARVSALVGENRFIEAIDAASDVAGADGAWLETWTRHEAGDLTGALTCARAALLVAPDDVRLLEQASYISNSLMLPDEALRFSKRLIEVDRARGLEQYELALKLAGERDGLEQSLGLSYLIIAAAAALLLWGLRLGTAGLSSKPGN